MKKKVSTMKKISSWIKFSIYQNLGMSRFEKATRPYDIQPTLWMSLD